jgi:glycosyltransferase involved in cell wall biosynthesis
LFAASERGTRACFHVADHSYAHLVHHLPRGSTGVYCHDADAFRALREPREQLTRRCMARWTLAGLRRASVIFYSTEVVRAELLSSGLLTNERLVHAPYGCSSEFDPTPTPLDDETRRRYGSEVLLHVGSCVPRKNTEFLLRFFADWRTRQPNAQLVQVGGTWPAAQLSLMRQLQIEKSVTQLRGVNRHQLAALYRQSQALLLPSSSEGFGLPLIEGLACGARVVASDIPVLREVGGAAARYAPISELDAWIRELRAALAAPRDEHRRAAQERAATYSWKRHAQTIVGEYRRLAKAGPAANHGGSS